MATSSLGKHSTLPISIIQPRWRGKSSPEGSTKNCSLEDIIPTGNDNQAISPYAVFRELKSTGKTAPDMRFQVSLPTPLSVVRGFVEDDGVCAQVYPLSEERLLQSLRRFQEYIPAAGMTVQWDLPTEVATLEYELGHTDDKYWKPYFAPVMDGILQRFVRLASAVGPDVEMGYHLCYEDFDHMHFVQPFETLLVVDLANAIVKNISPHHRVSYVQMPITKDELDETYFLPLKGLKLQGAKLFLGVVHARDENGTKRRLELARSIYSQVARISTECGMGRNPEEDLGSILAISALVTSV